MKRSLSYSALRHALHVTTGLERDEEDYLKLPPPVTPPLQRTEGVTRREEGGEERRGSQFMIVQGRKDDAFPLLSSPLLVSPPPSPLKPNMTQLNSEAE